MRWLWQPFGLGLLAGLMVNVPASTRAGGECPIELLCSAQKPGVVLIVDYSAAMNAPYGAGTRWDATTQTIAELVTNNGGYLDDHMVFSLVRVAHDPDPATAGTTIPGTDPSVVDGLAVDVPLVDAQGDFFHCGGDLLTAALQAAPDPCADAACTATAWLAGGLNRARTMIDEAAALNPGDPQAISERQYAAVVFTPGLWAGPDGTGQPPEHDPIALAATMLGDDVPVHVVAFDDAVGQPTADAIAEAGGTSAAVAPDGLEAVFLDFVVEVFDGVIIPDCRDRRPRLLTIFDASSTMLNVNEVAGSEGETPWDVARTALFGPGPDFFDQAVPPLYYDLDEFVSIGLLTYGSGEPDPQEVLAVPVQTCNEIGQALSPLASCQEGCDDPWGGPPIEWASYTWDSPIHKEATCVTNTSVMPRCDVDPMYPGACTGSGSALDHGVLLAQATWNEYLSQPPEPVADYTPLRNLVVLGSSFQADAAPQDVATPLMEMYADGIPTLVVTVGDAWDPVEAANVACWGSGGFGMPDCSGGNQTPISITDLTPLYDALVSAIDIDAWHPCCTLTSCGVADINPCEAGGTDSSGSGGSDTGDTVTSSGSGPATSGATGTGGTGLTSSSTRGADTTGSGEGDATTTPPDAPDNETTDSASDSAKSTEPGDDPTTSETDGDTAGIQLADRGCGCTHSSPSGLPWLFFVIVAFSRRRPLG